LSPLDTRAVAERAEAVREILAEMQAGIPAERSFRRLIGFYHHPVQRFFARRGFSSDDCLDLTQETFLGIYTGLSSFRRDASFDTWLFKIAMNVLLKRRRRQGAHKRAGEEVALEEAGEREDAAGPTDESPAPADQLLGKERSRLLRQAVEKLPPQMRRCLLLRVYQDLKYREIADVMSLSIETVKAHLYQARARLQTELGSYFDPPPEEGP
jgi:RNA polymerase sigma-70 factor (ECF subfamily)